MPFDRHKLPGVLLLILSALGFLIAALLAAVLSAWLFSAQPPAALPAQQTAAAAIAFLALLVALLNAPTLLQCLRYLGGHPMAPLRPEPRRRTACFFLSWLIILLVGSVANQHENARWLLIPLSLPAVFLPIGWLILTARRGLPGLPSLRKWGTLTIALTAAPILILILEFILLVAATLAVVVVAGFDPALLEHISTLPAALAEMQGGMEALEKALWVFYQEPIIATAIFVIIGAAAPLTEELLKPLAVWLLARRSLKASEGYSLGLISGGAFALLESATLVSQLAYYGDWFSAVAQRAVASLVHIGLSGWVGYGIASAREQKRFRAVLVSLVGATTLHGLWNSMALVSALSANPLAGESAAHQITTPALLAATVMLAVLAAIILVNVRISRALRQQPKESAAGTESDDKQPADSGRG